MKIVLKDVCEFKRMLIVKGLSIRGFGRSAGISEPYAIQLVNGERNPSPETAKKITDALQVEFDDIFFIDDGCKCKQSNETNC